MASLRKQAHKRACTAAMDCERAALLEEGSDDMPADEPGSSHNEDATSDRPHIGIPTFIRPQQSEQSALRGSFLITHDLTVGHEEAGRIALSYCFREFAPDLRKGRRFPASV
jgi:hypothetical protein